MKPMLSLIHICLVRASINALFKSDIRDIMTGYRAFSYRFVKTFPVPVSYTHLDVYKRQADLQGCEDYDLLLRAIDSGYQLGNCNQIILKYRLSRQSISRDNLYKQYLMMRYIQDKYFYHKLS